MFRKIIYSIFIMLMCFLILAPQAEARLWGSSNKTHYTYHAVMDSSTNTGALLKTILDHTGPGIIYMIVAKCESGTAGDAYVVVDLDGAIDTLTVENVTTTAYVEPCDTPDDDTAAYDNYRIRLQSDSVQFGRMDVYFSEYAKIQLYSEAVDATKEAWCYVSYGIPEQRGLFLTEDTGTVHLKYNAVMDTTSIGAAALATALDYSGSGILYSLGLAGENIAGHDPYVVVDIDGNIDTLTIAHSTKPFWLIPYDLPNTDVAGINNFSLSPDSTYHPANIWFEEYINVKFYCEAMHDDKQALVFISYGAAVE